MFRSPSSRSLLLTSAAVCFALLVAPPSEAQHKKAKKKTKTTTTTTTTAPAAAAAPVEPSEEPKVEAEVKPARKASEERTSEKEPEAGSKHPMLDVALGLRVFQRHLSYKDDILNRLPDYDLSAAPAGRLAVGFFPLQTPGISAGITGSFEYAFALGSKYKTPTSGQGDKLTTKSMQYSVGAKANFFSGTNTFSAAVEYGAQSFIVDMPPPTSTNAGVPDVNYHFVRPNLSGRFGIADKLSFLAGLGYLFVLSSGEILSAQYFPSDRAKVAGIDAYLGVSYHLAPRLELRPALDFRRYFYSFKPVNDGKSPYPAGGAIDDYYGLSVSVAYTM